MFANSTIVVFGALRLNIFIQVLFQLLKGPTIEKALTCIKKIHPVKTKMEFLSRKLILLVIQLHGQFIHHTQISLYPNTRFFTARQRAYQSFLSYFLVF